MSELTSHYALLLGLQRRAPTRTLNASTSADVAYYKTPDFFFSKRFEMDKTEKPIDIDGYIARLQNYKKLFAPIFVKSKEGRFQGSTCIS